MPTDTPTWDETEAVEAPPTWDETTPLESSMPDSGPVSVSQIRVPPKAGIPPNIPPNILNTTAKALGAANQAAGEKLKKEAEAAAFSTVGDVEDALREKGFSERSLERMGLRSEKLEQGTDPFEQGVASLPLPARLISRGTTGLIESAPQMAEVAGAEAVGIPAPVSAAGILGSTPQGFDVKQAAIGAVLPEVGKYTGGLTESVASRLGVSTPTALSIVNRMGGAGGVAVLLSADQIHAISQLPPDKRGDAFVSAAANALSMSWLGMMGEHPAPDRPARVAAAQLGQNAREVPTPENLRDFGQPVPPPIFETGTPPAPRPGIPRRPPETPQPKRNQPVEVPGTRAEPYETAIETIRKAGADTRKKIQALFPLAQLSNEQAAALRRQAFPESNLKSTDLTPQPSPIQESGAEIQPPSETPQGEAPPTPAADEKMLYANDPFLAHPKAWRDKRQELEAQEHNQPDEEGKSVAQLRQETEQLAAERNRFEKDSPAWRDANWDFLQAWQKWNTADIAANKRAHEAYAKWHREHAQDLGEAEPAQKRVTNKGAEKLAKPPSENRPVPTMEQARADNLPARAWLAIVEYDTNQSILESGKHPNGKKANPKYLADLKERQKQVVRNFHFAVERPFDPNIPANQQPGLEAPAEETATRPGAGVSEKLGELFQQLLQTGLDAGFSRGQTVNMVKRLAKERGLRDWPVTQDAEDYHKLIAALREHVARDAETDRQIEVRRQADQDQSPATRAAFATPRPIKLATIVARAGESSYDANTSFTKAAWNGIAHEIKQAPGEAAAAIQRWALALRQAEAFKPNMREARQEDINRLIMPQAFREALMAVAMHGADLGLDADLRRLAWREATHGMTLTKPANVRQEGGGESPTIERPLVERGSQEPAAPTPTAGEPGLNAPADFGPGGTAPPPNAGLARREVPSVGVGPSPSPSDTRSGATTAAGESEPAGGAGVGASATEINQPTAAAPVGEFSSKAAKEQKKFLLNAIDNAIAEAPETLPKTEYEKDAERVVELERYQAGETENDFKARQTAHLLPFLDKYKTPRVMPAQEAVPSLIEGQPVIASRESHVFTTEELLDKVKAQIEQANFKSKPKVTIEVPGDGEFEIINSKEALKDFKDRAQKFPATAPRVGKPPVPRSEPTAPPPLGKLDRDATLKALSLIVSQDSTRENIFNKIWSDGKQTVATNGRMLTHINQGVGGTEKKPSVFTPEGKEIKPGKDFTNFPNWRQIVPPETDFQPPIPNLSTQKLFTLLKQAQQTLTDRVSSVVLYLNPDHTLGIASRPSEVGSYQSNIQNGYKTLLAADPKYLLNAINAARHVGDDTLSLHYIDELSPFKLAGKNSFSIIMPMRLEGGIEGIEPPPASGGVHAFGARTRAVPPPPGPAAPTTLPPAPATAQQLTTLQNNYTPGLVGGAKSLLSGISTGVGGAVKGVKLRLLPSTISKVHLTEAERLGSFLGPMHRAAEAANAALKPASKYFDKQGVHRDDLPPAQNPGLQFMSAMSTGAPLPPHLQNFATQIQRLFYERFRKLEAADAPLETIRANYFPGMWTRQSREAFNTALYEAVDNGIVVAYSDLNQATPAQKAWIKARVEQLMEAGQGSERDMLGYLTRRPLAGSESFRKPKVFEDIMSAVEFGLRPISNNPIDLVKLKLAEMDRSILGHREFQSLKQDGKLKVISPYEQVPTGWVKVNDQYGTIYGPPTTPVNEYIDKAVYEGLLSVAARLGIRHERSMTFPKGPGRSALGLSYQGQPFVRTRFATETSVLAHEIGHQLDYRYGLWDYMTGGEKGNERNSVWQKELRAIADLTGRRKDYARSKPEKIAQMVEGYVHAKDRMVKVAPNIFTKLDAFIRGTPELKAMADLKPGLELDKLTSEKYVGLPILGYRIVPEATGDILNNYLSSSWYNNKYFGPLYRGWMAFSNALNQSQLGWGSLFHASFTTGEAYMSGGANVIKDAYGVFVRRNRSLADLTNTAKNWTTAALQTAVTGDKVLDAWRNPHGVMDPKIANVVRAAELAGGGFKMEKGLTTDQTTKLVRDWYSNKKIKAAFRSPLALGELSTRLVMEGIVPRQKAGVFAELANRIIEQNPGKSLEELTPQFRQAWNRTDARLGQVRYDRLFAHNTWKSVIQGLVRAPGWTGGTIAEIGGAFPDTAKFLHEWITTGKAPENIPC